MPRTSSVALQLHKAQAATTLCYLNKIGPLPITGDYVCLTSHSKDFTYDDGTGSLVYYASTGIELSAFTSKNDLSVDNGDAHSLVELPAYPSTGITQEMIDTGALDGVRYVIYEVNWRDGSMSHEIQTSGPIGEVRQLRGGQITFELRTWSQYLKQNSVVELDSLNCRVKKFGSQAGEERYPCLYDLAAEVVAPVAVTSVGAEPVCQFTASALGQATDYFVPGHWVWDTGDNAGTVQKIKAFVSGGVIELRMSTKHPIQAGDTGHPRRDCTRAWSGHNSCETYANRPHFRGEPKMRLADTIALSIPGAGI